MRLRLHIFYPTVHNKLSALLLKKIQSPFRGTLAKGSVSKSPNQITPKNHSEECLFFSYIAFLSTLRRFTGTMRAILSYLVDYWSNSCTEYVDICRIFCHKMRQQDCKFIIFFDKIKTGTSELL